MAVEDTILKNEKYIREVTQGVQRRESVKESIKNTGFTMSQNVIEPTLIRMWYTPMGTFGRLQFDEFMCFTIELPWRENIPRESCIPTGRYPLVLSYYNRGGYSCYELKDVPDRNLIKIHKANTTLDILGCIGPGSSFGCIRGRWAVVNSSKTFKGFMEAMQGETETHINIHNHMQTLDYPMRD